MSLFDLTGRVALVTGGNRGIGLAMGRAMADAGASIVVAGRNAALNRAAADELTRLGAKVLPLESDVSDAEACRVLVDRAAGWQGRLDILVNNAGTNLRKAPQDYSLDEWRWILDTNLTSAFVCSQAAYPHFRTGSAGKIINIGSMFSIFGASFAAAYGASKGGMVQMTKALASAWAAEDIQVNAVLPGWIDTELTRQARKDVDGLHDRVIARTPAGRWGVPADLAGIAVFLASHASDFVNGAVIPVDGGYAAQG
ncbi:MAG: SDR family NAD(P)-dependent oxidoreductase [Chloroflexota bacterium]